jgi:hypothetical protein
MLMAAKMAPMLIGSPRGPAGPSLNLADAPTFDGTNWLERTSDLAGNADGGTMTLSLWYKYTEDWGFSRSIFNSNANNTGTGQRVWVFTAGATSIGVYAANSGGSLMVYATATSLGKDNWNHLLVSLDMSSSSLRHIYVNDASGSPSWSVYSGSSIDFTTMYHTIGNREPAASSGERFRGQACHVYLDKTYRDLGTTGNRRLFNDGSGAPAAGQAALSPIIYLPMTDPAARGLNLGTGGDYAVQGSL